MALDSDRSIVLQAVSGATATNAVFVSTSDWTITFPDGVNAPLSGVPYVLQVNNSNPHDPNKAHHYVNPTMFGIQSVANQVVAGQISASASDFEQNWVNVGDITASAYVGSGNFRYIRVVNTGGFTGSASAFKGYFYSWNQNHMI